MGLRPQNMLQTSNSLLSPTKSMVARGNQWQPLHTPLHAPLWTPVCTSLHAPICAPPCAPLDAPYVQHYVHPYVHPTSPRRKFTSFCLKRACQ